MQLSLLTALPDVVARAIKEAMEPLRTSVKHLSGQVMARHLTEMLWVANPTVARGK